MAGKKGARKTVGKARKGDIQKQVIKLFYVQKPNGAFAPRFEPLPTPEVEETPAGN